MNQSSVVDDLTELLNKKPLEFDIAILRSTEDGDPFLLSDDGIHLGLHAGDIAWVAKEFRHGYYTIRSNFLLLQTCNDEEESRSNDIRKQLLKITQCLLLVCPDHATAWADRKRALLIEEAETNNNNDNSNNNDNNDTTPSTTTRRNIWEKEIQFLNLVMTKHTKAPTSWFHRKYILQKLIDNIIIVSNSKKDADDADDDDDHVSSSIRITNLLLELTKKEIKHCIRVAEQYPKNYYAWTHRIHVVQVLYKILFQDYDNENKNGTNNNNKVNNTKMKQQYYLSLLEEEWSSITESWFQRHVSDHSAAHYAGSILRMILKMYIVDVEGNDGKDNKHPNHNKGILFAWNAVNSSKHLVEQYTTHEVLWIFRRICSHAYLSYIMNSFSLPQSPQEQQQHLLQQSAVLGDSISMFWRQEIQDLIVTGNNLFLESASKSSSGIDDETHYLEETKSCIYALSYLVWNLEYIISTVVRKQPRLIFLEECLGLHEQDIVNLRSQVLSMLYEMSFFIPYNVYLACTTTTTDK